MPQLNEVLINFLKAFTKLEMACLMLHDGTSMGKKVFPM